MMLLRVRPNQGMDHRRALAVGLLSTLTRDWTIGYLSLLIETDSVPKKHIETIVCYLGKHPSLFAIRKDEFLAATKEARPDLYPLLASPEGDHWLNHAMGDLSKALVARSVSWFIQGG